VAAAPTPSAPRTGLLAGASGLVGRALLPLLLDPARYRSVHALLRRPLADLPSDSRLQVHVVDFARLPMLPAVDDVYIALGTTIKVAGSQDAFRRVDFDAVIDTARAARAAGATRLLVVSALGADPSSRIFYNRVKGDMQQAAAGLGYASVVFAQPSLLIGDRAALGQPVRRGEVWGERLLRPVMRWVPRGMRPIRAGNVARALVDAAFDDASGVRVLSSAQMQS
jgi:uncharacterized protein YbjT (DUF2867 family)